MPESSTGAFYVLRSLRGKASGVTEAQGTWGSSHGMVILQSTEPGSRALTDDISSPNGWKHR